MTKPKDYTREADILRRISSMSNHVETIDVFARPVSALGKLMGLTRLEQAAEGVCQLRQIAVHGMLMSRYLIGAQASRKSRLVFGLWTNAPEIATVMWGDTQHHWRDVLGVPVVCDCYNESYWFASPESTDQIMDRIRAAGQSWLIGHQSMCPDPRVVPETVGTRASRVIERVRRFEVCRAQLLWGPPGGGKTVAARQIIRELSSASVTLSPRAAVLDEVWDRVDELRPDGILVDDIDSITDLDSLLDRLAYARRYARIIISTANTIGSLRGALKRPGRASDDAPVMFDSLDDQTAKMIAPSVSDDARSSGLLAAYLAELESRVVAGVVTNVAEDIAELARRMEEAGQR